ncbi:MAG: DUF427 domain-containing protein [Chloroflexi bacterium]|nr:DUF427 domain-containing protein [Chloroflexota bacterium]
MPRAIWNGIVLAESDHTEVVEGNHYFPPDAVNWDYLKPTQHHTACPWKGVASYYDLELDGDIKQNAAWTYPEPKSAAANIANHVAFYSVVRIED